MCVWGPAVCVGEVMALCSLLTVVGQSGVALVWSGGHLTFPLLRGTDTFMLPVAKTGLRTGFSGVLPRRLEDVAA